MTTSSPAKDSSPATPCVIARPTNLVVVGYMPVVAAHGDSANRVLSRIYTHEYETHCDEIEADPRLVLLHLWGGNVSLRRADYISTGFPSDDAERGSSSTRTSTSASAFTRRA